MRETGKLTDPLEFDFHDDGKNDSKSKVNKPLEKPFMPRWLSVFVVLSAGAVLFFWALGTPPGSLGKIDAIAYAICHRIADHSFAIDVTTGLMMPLCARCTGIYLGAMLGLLFAVINKRTRVVRRPSLSVSLVLLVFVGIMGIDGLNSYVTLFPGLHGVYEPHNWLRLVTGMYCGIAVFQFVFPTFNSVIWRRPDTSTQIINNWRELAALCLMGAFMILVVLSDRPIFMMILGYVSVFGVLIMLTMIGTVIFVSIARLERKARRWNDLLFPLIAGLTIAFIEIGGMDVLRFALTRTWNGFNFG